MHILAGEVVGVLAHVERTDQHRTRRLKALDQRRVAFGRRMIAIDLGTGERRKSRDVEQVLDRERNARERTERLALRPRTINCPRPESRSVGDDHRKGVKSWVACGDPAQCRLDDVERTRSTRHRARNVRG